jgi:hypothetical protein
MTLTIIYIGIKMNKKILGLALVSGLAVTAGAQAATFTASDSLAHSITDLETGSSTLNLGQFDASLGTLNSITITLSGESISDTVVSNTSAQSQRFSYVSTLDWEFEVLAGSGTFVPAFQTALASTGGRVDLAAGGTLDLGTTTDSGIFTLTVAAADFGQFVGNGTSAIGCNTFTNSSFSGGGGNLSAAQNTTGACSAEISYDYTGAVATVAEPASLALMGLGLGFMGFTRRNKKA